MVEGLGNGAVVVVVAVAVVVGDFVVVRVEVVEVDEVVVEVGRVLDLVVGLAVRVLVQYARFLKVILACACLLVKSRFVVVRANKQFSISSHLNPPPLTRRKEGEWRSSSPHPPANCCSSSSPDASVASVDSVAAAAYSDSSSSVLASPSVLLTAPQSGWRD